MKFWFVFYVCDYTDEAKEINGTWNILYVDVMWMLILNISRHAWKLVVLENQRIFLTIFDLDSFSLLLYFFSIWPAAHWEREDLMLFYDLFAEQKTELR